MSVTMSGARAAGADPAVQGLDAATYVVPTDAPEADGTLAWDKTTLVLVTARAGGQQGIGWSYAAAAAPVVTGILSDVVTGRSALDVPGANEAMARALRNVGRPGIGAMALSAADIALWDLKARLLGCALTGLIGRAREDVPVYGSGGFTTYDEARTREQLAGWVGGWVGGQGGNPPRQDQDRRVVGWQRTA
jgi:L-alanine-DL-glutamate epimerase-like enolase superfamily enzyme